MTQAHSQPTHVFDWSDLKAWFAEYGLSADHVTDARIVLGRRDDGLAAWLDVEWFKLDSEGRMYRDPDDPDDAARGRSSIPLRSWPPLLPVSTGEVDE